MPEARRMKFAVVLSFALLPLLGADIFAKERPEIVRLDAQYLDTVVKITLQWQSPNLVTFVRAIVGKEQREVIVDAYDNKRNPDGYWGEATVVVTVSQEGSQNVVPYVIQVEDELRQKSEEVSGNVRPMMQKESTGGIQGGGGGSGSTPQGSGVLTDGSSVQGGFQSPGASGWSVKTLPGQRTDVLGKVIGMMDQKLKEKEVASPSSGAVLPTVTPQTIGPASNFRILQNDGFAPGGRSPAFLNGLQTGDEVAVVLGPVDRSFQVTKIAVLCGGSSGPGTFSITISQDAGGGTPGPPLFTATHGITGCNGNIQELDMTATPVGPIPGGRIWVSFLQMHNGFPGIGYDPVGAAFPGRNFVSRAGVRSDFGSAGVPGNGIVRVTVAFQ